MTLYRHHGVLTCTPSVTRARTYYDELQAQKENGAVRTAFEEELQHHAYGLVKNLPGIEVSDVILTASFGFSYHQYPESNQHPVIMGSSHCIWTVEAKLADPAPFVVVITRAYLEAVWGAKERIPPDFDVNVKVTTKWEQVMLAQVKNDKLIKRRISR